MMDVDRYALKLRAAGLYYKKKLNQAEIARMLAVSRPTLIKLLKEAHEEGIVHIEIRDVRKIAEYNVLENQLKGKLGLKGVKIIPVTSDNNNVIRTGIGRAATPYVLEYIKSGMKIGVGWGRTMEEFARSIPAEKRIRDVRLMPVMGGPGSADGYTMLSNMLCEVIASKFISSNIDYIYAPLFVDNPLVYDAYMSMPNIKATQQHLDELDIALVGVDGDANHSTTFNVEGEAMNKRADPEQFKQVAGNVCSHCYDIDGNMLFPEWDGRRISISVKQMRKIPTVIGLAGGEYKVRGIIGGAKAKLFNVLVTDNFTAKKIMMV